MVRPNGSPARPLRHLHDADGETGLELGVRDALFGERELRVAERSVGADEVVAVRKTVRDRRRRLDRRERRLGRSPNHAFAHPGERADQEPAPDATRTAGRAVERQARAFCRSPAARRSPCPVAATAALRSAGSPRCARFSAAVRSPGSTQGWTFWSPWAAAPPTAPRRTGPGSGHASERSVTFASADAKTAGPAGDAQRRISDTRSAARDRRP